MLSATKLKLNFKTMTTNSFTKPEIFEMSELELSYHPNFDIYFTNPKLPESGYWFYSGSKNNTKLAPQLIDFLNEQLNGRVVEFCASGDFAGVIKVSYPNGIFDFLGEEKPDKYFHVCEQNNGTVLSKYIIYTDNEDEKENVDGLHEQRYS